MGFLDFIRGRRKNVATGPSSEEDKRNEQSTGLERGYRVNNLDNYIYQISLYELQKIDYVTFASELKLYGLLPPSYDKNPSNIEFSYDLGGLPKVELTFKSKTNSNLRKLSLYINGCVREEVNGNSKNNSEVEDIWKSTLSLFKEEIKQSRNNEVNEGIKAAEDEIRKGTVYLHFMKGLLERENYFLNRNQNRLFVSIVPLTYGGYAFNNDADDAYIPETPKELELCFLNLSDEVKLWLAEDNDFDYFYKICETLKNNSLYKSDNWDSVINSLRKYLEDFYKEHEKMRHIENTGYGSF
jgi:hypothetical protein